jgi:predicted AAA+ superfamily ATPase
LKFEYVTFEFHGSVLGMIRRRENLGRQCGKTTLAREIVPVDSVNYFDLERPDHLARLDEPMTALQPLRGVVVIDEIQRRPELFPVLRVLADRRPLPARFLILGSDAAALSRPSPSPAPPSGR